MQNHTHASVQSFHGPLNLRLITWSASCSCRVRNNMGRVETTVSLPMCPHQSGECKMTRGSERQLMNWLGRRIRWTDLYCWSRSAAPDQMRSSSSKDDEKVHAADTGCLHRFFQLRSIEPGVCPISTLLLHFSTVFGSTIWQLVSEVCKKLPVGPKVCNHMRVIENFNSSVWFVSVSLITWKFSYLSQSKW